MKKTNKTIWLIIMLLGAPRFLSMQVKQPVKEHKMAIKCLSDLQFRAAEIVFKL